MRFTDRGIRALKPKSERYVVWKDHGDGLGMRVSLRGKKTFVYMYRLAGKARMLTLGPYGKGPGKLSLADAHTEHGKARQLLDKEIDPGEKAVGERQEALRAPTVQRLADRYLEQWAKPRKRSWKEDERILNKDVLPLWGRRKAASIPCRDVVALLDDIVDRGSPISANRTFAVIRKMFNFGVSKDLIPASPCAAIGAPAKEKQRDRVLKEDEIRALWSGLASAKMVDPTKLALKLQLVTAQRKGEVLGAEWSEFDLDRGWWEIPESKAKNGVLHRVPLSSQALTLLTELNQLTGHSKWLVPSPRGDKPITGAAVCRAITRNAGEMGIAPFIPHDLRRTAASYMAGMGTPRLVIGKILNHVESGVTAIYDRHRYDKEKKEALDAWGQRLESIVSRESDD